MIQLTNKGGWKSVSCFWLTLCFAFCVLRLSTHLATGPFRTQVRYRSLSSVAPPWNLHTCMLYTCVLLLLRIREVRFRERRFTVIRSFQCITVGVWFVSFQSLSLRAFERTSTCSRRPAGLSPCCWCHAFLTKYFLSSPLIVFWFRAGKGVVISPFVLWFPVWCKSMGWERLMIHRRCKVSK